MAKETAFGGSNSYRALKAEGHQIGTSGDPHSVNKWAKRLLSDNPVELQQASAVCYARSDVNPNLFQPFTADIIMVIRKNVHDAGPRFGYRVLSEMNIQGEHLGEIIDVSFEALTKKSNPIAVKVFAMAVIGNHLGQFPDLGIELAAILKEDLPNSSAGYRSRAKKIIKKHNLSV